MAIRKSVSISKIMIEIVFNCMMQVVMFFPLALEIKFQDCKYPVMISPTAVQELHQITVGDNGVRFGGSVTLTKIQETLQKEIDSRPGETLSNQSLMEFLSVPVDYM